MAKKGVKTVKYMVGARGKNVIEINFNINPRKVFAMAAGTRIILGSPEPKLYVHIYHLPYTCVPDHFAILTDAQALAIYDKNPMFFNMDALAWNRITFLAYNRRKKS